MGKLKRKININVSKLEHLMIAKEIWLDKLRGKIVKKWKDRKREIKQ